MSELIRVRYLGPTDKVSTRWSLSTDGRPRRTVSRDHDLDADVDASNVVYNYAQDLLDYTRPHVDYVGDYGKDRYYRIYE